MTTSRRTFTGALAAGGLGRAAPSGGGADAIRTAVDAVRAAIPKAAADPHRPAYHFRPPAQWNNDPNGPIWYRGWYHLFYQHNPFDAVWGHMHWGHARSRDLVDWEHLPIALWPSTEKGEEHVYSGGAIAGPDGRPLLFYTSIGKRDPEQWLAVPADDDLIAWKKYEANPVLMLSLHGGRKVWDWRDPFLFREAGRTFLVTGGNLDPRGGYGAVQLYEALNRGLTGWRHRGTVFRHPDRGVRNIECPNLFRVGGKWVLLVSPHRPVEYFVGEFDAERGRFTPETQGVLDPGSAYASNVAFDPAGRCILWLWARTETPAGRGWNCAMALPRVLTVGEDGHLRQEPVAAFTGLRGAPAEVSGTVLAERPVALGAGFAGDCLEVEAYFDAGSARRVGLHLAAPDGRPALSVAWSPASGTVTAGRWTMFVGRGSELRLRVFVDRSLVEVYANGGAAAMVAAVPGGLAGARVEAFAEPAARLVSARAWALRPARFSLDHFRV